MASMHICYGRCCEITSAGGWHWQLACQCSSTWPSASKPTTWSLKKSNIRESVMVRCNGKPDRHLSAHWSDIVEELIPLGISRLFFFDAEQVRFLADDDSAHVALGSVVKSLLGLDLAEKLIEHLSKEVGDAFQFLLRKQSLIERVEIDPESFRITLYDTNGEVLPKERLSEGEKQIFAISVLWGLAKSSPRPLPAIIDTPMARLDSEQRGHLIKRFAERVVAG